MPSEIHQCECALCASGTDHPEREHHHQMNVFMDRLDEQQRRWYAAMEVNRRPRGGLKLVCQIIGWDEKTIRQGQAELGHDLANRPRDRICLPGGGRPRAEKKTEG